MISYNAIMQPLREGSITAGNITLLLQTEVDFAQAESWDAILRILAAIVISIGSRFAYGYVEHWIWLQKRKRKEHEKQQSEEKE